MATTSTGYATAASGSQSAGSWASTTNATGSQSGTFAAWTSTTANSTGTLDLSGYNGQTLLDDAQPTSIDAVHADVANYVSNSTARMASITAQLLSGTTPIGSPVTLTKSTTSTNVETIAFGTMPTWAQCADLRVKIVFTRANVTTTCIGRVDYVGVNLDYTRAPIEKAGLAAGGAVGTGVQAVESLPAEWTVSIDLARVVVVYVPTEPVPEHIRAGRGVGAGVGAGTQTVQTHVETATAGLGAATAAALGAQAVQSPTTYEKAGLAAGTAAVLGGQAVQLHAEVAKVGLVAGTTAALGAQALTLHTEHAKAGLVAGATAALGAQALTLHTEHAKAGLVAGTAAALGAQALTLHIEYTEDGLAAGTTVALGTQVVQASGAIVRAGLVAADAVATGTQTVEWVRAGVGAGAAVAAGAQTVTPPTTYQKVVLSAVAAVAAGVQTVTPPTTYQKVGLGAVAAVATGTQAVQSPTTVEQLGTVVGAATVGGVARITTGPLYAGTATEITGTWVDEPNAVGSSTGDYATWTDEAEGSSATLELAEFNPYAVVPDSAPIESVMVVVRHAEDPADQLASVIAQAYVGATPHGDPVELVRSASLHTDTLTINDLTYADLADLRVRVTATRT